MLLQKELQSQLLKVGAQLLTPRSSRKDLIGLWDKVGSLLSQVLSGPSKTNARCVTASTGSTLYGNENTRRQLRPMHQSNNDNDNDIPFAVTIAINSTLLPWIACLEVRLVS